MAEVTLQGISKSFGPVTALDDVTMTIPDGSFVVLLGPTGAGKTTMLRLVSGLDQPDRGDVLDRPTPGDRPDPGAAQRRHGLPAVFALPAPLGAREPRLPAEVPDPAHAHRRVESKVRAVAEVLQITHKLDNKATALSGGEMQRVSIGGPSSARLRST